MPAYRAPLLSLARAMAQFAAAGRDAPRSPLGTVLAAMQQHLELVVGEGGLSSHIPTLPRGNIVVKGGAEGVFVAGVPSQRLGIALKIEDGTQRAADVALVSVLREQDLLDDDLVKPSLGGVFRIRNFRGEPVGSLQWTALA